VGSGLGALRQIRAEAVNVDRCGAEIVQIRNDRNVHIPGDNAGIVDELGHRHERLVGHRHQFLVGPAAADEHALVAMNLAEPRRQEIVGIAADQRFRTIHQFAKARTHGSCGGARGRCRSGGQRCCDHDQSRSGYTGALEKLASIRFPSHDISP